MPEMVWNFVFQQDKAPKHKAKVIMDWISKARWIYWSSERT